MTRSAAVVRLAADIVPTPLGPIHVVCDGIALCALDYDDFTQRMHALLHRRYGNYVMLPVTNPLGVRDRLERYFAGQLAALDDVRVEPGGTPFAQRVWQRLRAIPHGQTRTYGQLAAELGGTHARAVGHANALNPIAIVIPCHRVIGADASLTGYAGGLDRKRRLLDHEARAAGLTLPFT